MNPIRTLSFAPVLCEDVTVPNICVLVVKPAVNTAALFKKSLLSYYNYLFVQLVDYDNKNRIIHIRDFELAMNSYSFLFVG